jgi:hypothetical protein
MALRKILILRRLAERGLKGRTTPVQTIANFPTPTKVRESGGPGPAAVLLPPLHFRVRGNDDGALTR